MENQKIEEYLKVKEFAEIVGITPQAVYKQLNNKLKDYWKRDKKQLLIAKSAISLYETPQKTTVEQQFNNELLNELKNQLNKKDEQISNLERLLNQEQQLRAADFQKIAQLEEKNNLLIEQINNKKWWQFWK